MTENEILLALSNMLDGLDGKKEHEITKEDISLLKKIVTEYIGIKQKIS